MLTLAFDTTAGRCAVGLFLDENQLSERVARMEKGHAERLFPMIEETLADAGRVYADIRRIAVCTGPGNFTGARIGVAAARGLSVSTGAKAIGVDRFQALAAGRDDAVCVALAARSDMLHIARFENGAPALAAATMAPSEAAAFAVDAVLIGDGAHALRQAVGAGRIGDASGDAPLSAIAAIARRAATDAPRPAPRYLRPVNASPPREAPPTILP